MLIWNKSSTATQPHIDPKDNVEVKMFSAPKIKRSKTTLLHSETVKYNLILCLYLPKD